MKANMKTIALACLITAATGLAPADALAVEGTITRMTSIGGELRFWLKECGDGNAFYFSQADASREQAKLIVMAARFSGRPIAVSVDCPSGSNRRVTQIDLIQY